MEEKWLNEIRSKLENYKEPAPYNLWNSIEKKLKHKQRIYHAIFLWVKYPAIAAILLIIIFIGNNIFSPKNNKLFYYTKIQVTSKNAFSNNFIAKEDIYNKSHTLIVEKSEQEINHKKKAKTLHVSSDSIDVTNSHINKNESQDSSKYISKEEKYIPIKKLYSSYNTNKDPHIVLNKNKKHYSIPITIELYASNLTTISSSMNGQGELLTAYANNKETTSEQESIRKIWLNNLNKPTQTKITHTQPIRIGLSFNYPLNNHIIIGSGLSYSCLSSTFHSGTPSSNIHTQQNLHYLGIPIKIKYNLWKNKKINIYVSTGTMAEKCISGKTNTDYILNYNVVSVSSQNIKENSLQLSTNSSAGLQFNFTPQIGLYVEPGISYFINNGSEIKNIYKQKKLNFNLEFGLNFSIKY